MAKMTLTEFVEKYIGTKIDYDGAAGAQCVDLIKLYLAKVFGIAQFSFGGSAKNLYEDFNTMPKAVRDAFTRIANTPTFVPQRGDICVWGGSVGGGHGHVAIASNVGNTQKFTSWDMNWSGKEMHLQVHDYHGFLGVLRPKDQAAVVLTNKSYFKRYAGTDKSIVDALEAIGQPSSRNYRKKIAAENGITGYAGLPSQNKKMLDLLKAGKLIKP